MFQALVFSVNHNFEETHRAWGQRAVETLPPTQNCLAGHTVMVSIKDESRERTKGAEKLRKERGEEEEEKGNLPQPPIHSSCSSWDDLGDEDPRIIRNVGIVYSSSDAEAQARVSLHTHRL